MHRQANGAKRSAIGQASKGSFGWFSEGNRSDASMTSRVFRDIPRVISGIGSQMGRELMERVNGLAVERFEICHISFIEGLGELGQDHIAIVRGRGSGDAGAVAPEQFLFLVLSFGAGGRWLLLVGGRRGGWRRVLRRLLVGAAFDPQSAIRITWQAFGFVITLFHVGALVVFLDGSP